MSLETLLEAAKYVEYRSEAKARGEEPHDYFTFSKLSAAGKDDFSFQNEQILQRNHSTLSNSSSEEVKEKRRSTISLSRESVISNEHSGTGTREVHNKLEKNRRAHLKECFEALKKQLPNMDDRKTSNLSILRGAIRYIQTLKRKEREYEHDMERLAREKISFQQRLSTLKKDLSSQLDHIDVSNYVAPEEDNETTTTASECGVLSDFDDSLHRDTSNVQSNLISDLTSSSSSSTASGMVIASVSTSSSTVPTTAAPKQAMSNVLLSVPSKESAVSPNGMHFSSDSILAITSKNTFSQSGPATLPVHSLPTSDNCNAQTARVFSTGNLHAMANIFAAPHTMQVITQPSGIKVITAPNNMTSSMQHISVNHHPHGQIHVLAPSTSSYASSIAVTSPKQFSSDSLVHMASTTAKNVSKPHLVSPLALMSPQAMVGISQGTPISKSLVNHTTVISDLVTSSGMTAPVNQPHNLVKANSVLSGNVAIAVKNSMHGDCLSPVVASCASHSNMIGTLHMSKSHPHVIQSSLAPNAASIMSHGGSQINNGTHHGVTTSLKPMVSNPVRSLSHITHVAHVVSQSSMTTPVGQIVTPGNHVSTVTPLVGPVSVVSHTGSMHQSQILAANKVLATPVLKTVNQINQIPIIQQQFLQQVSVGSPSSQPIVKPVVVVSMPSVVPGANMSPLAPGPLVPINEQSGVVQSSNSHK